MARKKLKVPKEALPLPTKPGLVTAVNVRKALQKIQRGQRLTKPMRTGL